MTVRVVIMGHFSLRRFRLKKCRQGYDDRSAPSKGSFSSVGRVKLSVQFGSVSDELEASQSDKLAALVRDLGSLALLFNPDQGLSFARIKVGGVSTRAVSNDPLDRA
jgi:hypothetical protein